MASVVTRTHPSVHSAYLAMRDRLGVSPAALYEKLNHAEPQVASVMVRQTAADAAKVIDSMPSAKKVILPGLEVFYLDGNHLAATEIDWPSCGPLAKAHCRGNPWPCSTRSED